jgi:hypothetical protein
MSTLLKDTLLQRNSKNHNKSKLDMVKISYLHRLSIDILFIIISISNKNILNEFQVLSSEKKVRFTIGHTFFVFIFGHSNFPNP